MRVRTRAGAMTTVAGAVLLGLSGCGGTAQGSPSAQPTLALGSRSAEPSAVASPSAAVLSGGIAARPLGSVEGAPLGYLEYLPPDYGDGEPRPLLVFLHGSGEAGAGTAVTLNLVAELGIPPLIEAGDWPADRPFIVLMPQYGTEPASGECDIANELASFLDFAMQHYEVDARRVYLTGISCGAIGVWDYLASNTDEVVAASVLISGHAEWAFEKAGCALARAPVWAFHGNRDDIVPTVHIQGPMDRIRACDEPASIEMRLTVYPDADHDAWTRTYDLSAGHDIYAWLLEHQTN